MSTEKNIQTPQTEKPLVKMALDIGPLLLFFLTNSLGKSQFALNEIQRITAATSVFIVATLISLVIGYILTKKVSPMTLFSAILVLFFGGLTVFLQDQTFFQIKFTLINAFFGLLILGGLIFNKPLLALVLSQSLKMTDEGWRKMSLQWGLFFLATAGINEVLRRMVDWDTWTNIKFFVLMPLMFVFAIIQTIFMMRHMIIEPTTDKKSNKEV